MGQSNITKPFETQKDKQETKKTTLLTCNMIAKRRRMADKTKKKKKQDTNINKEKWISKCKSNNVAHNTAEMQNNQQWATNWRQRNLKWPNLNT